MFACWYGNSPRGFIAQRSCSAQQQPVLMVTLLFLGWILCFFYPSLPSISDPEYRHGCYRLKGDILGQSLTTVYLTLELQVPKMIVVFRIFLCFPNWGTLYTRIWFSRP
ncbi:hypothetical protein IW262DRAFT_1405576 [Armillaria fumosa]|nr:hypothetical protein IW262DRAFT_1405576 [Armillaria fumosa]